MLFIASCKKACPGLVALKKTGRMVKLTTLFLLAGFLQLSAKIYSQGITLILKDAPITTAFKKIQEQTPYRFVYSSEEIVNTLKVTCSLEHAAIDKVLETCFKDQPLSYSIEEQFILVKAKEKIMPVVVPNEIHGTVTNEKGEPVQGVSILIKGSNKGTVTDNRGLFLLSDVPAGSKLVISSIGFETQELIIGKVLELNVHLVTVTNELDETIVKGYYTTTKKLNTGSVFKLAAADINKQPVMDPIAALEGRVPGLFIQQSSGAPGSAFKVQLRGINSISSGTNPLYIVDGIPFASTTLTDPNLFQGADVSKSPFNSINPSDIESIEILKDADATAIYGSRGSNGVVLITTKKAGAGKTSIDVDFYAGNGKVTRTIDLLNTRQYLAMRHEAYANDGQIPNTNTGRDLLLWDTSRYTDWQKIFIGGTAHLKDLQLSVSGGSENTRFLLGAGYHSESTVYPGDFRDTRASAHLNFSNTSTDKKFRTVLSASYSSDNNGLPKVDLMKYIRLAPDAPAIYDSSGKLNWQNSTWVNPFSYLQQTYKGVTDNLISNLQLSWSPVNDFSIKTSFSFSNTQFNQLIKNPLYSNDPSFLQYYQAESDFATNNIKSWIIEPQADYHKSIGTNTFSVLAGATFQENAQHGTGQVATGFSNDALLENIQAAASVITVSSFNTLYRYNGLYARLNLNHDDTYLLNITGRRDGSSRFGPGRQFANFGAVGAAWIFSKYHFVNQHFAFLNFGKLRASYGITGNDQIGDYQYLSTYSAYRYQYMGVTGLYPGNLLNPDYGWETNKKLEAAVELGMFNNRLNLVINYYRNRSSNQLVGYSLPTITGFGAVVGNRPATIQNTGWEIDLSGTGIKTRNFSWYTSFNITIPRNKLVSYSELATSSYTNKYAIGYPLNILKLYHYVKTDPNTGIYQFEKQSDHSVTTDPKNPDDYIVKDMSVRYYGGLLNSFKYKGFALDVFFQFVKEPALNYFTQFSVPGLRENQPTYILDRWQQPGDIKNTQKYTQTFSTVYNAWNNNQQSDYAVTDGSFIRLKNLSLSWQLPPALLQKMKINQLRFFVHAQNLLTITSYKGFDPESNGLLPPLKVFTAGFHCTF